MKKLLCAYLMATLPIAAAADTGGFGPKDESCERFVGSMINDVISQRIDGNAKEEDVLATTHYITLDRDRQVAKLVVQYVYQNKLAVGDVEKKKKLVNGICRRYK